MINRQASLAFLKTRFSRRVNKKSTQTGDLRLINQVRPRGYRAHHEVHVARNG